MKNKKLIHKKLSSRTSIKIAFVVVFAIAGIILLAGSQASEDSNTDSGSNTPVSSVTAAPADRIITSADQAEFANGFTVPAGEVWEFDPDNDVTIETDANVTVYGLLRIKPSRSDILHTLKFINIDESVIQGGGYASDPADSPAPLDTDVGLWVMKDGQLDIRGEPRRGWTHAASTLPAGTTTIPLKEEPVGWKIGDQIMITPTKDPNQPGFYNGFEHRTITAINGLDITIDNPLADNHPLVNNLWTAEIANMTRNVHIEGTETGRMHTLINSNSPQTIRYAQFRHAGPLINGEVADAGRYGLHFHHSYAGGPDSLVEGLVMRDINNHALVPHRSNGVTFRDVVTHDTVKHAMWWDTRGCTRCDDHHPTHNLVFDHILVSLVKSEISYQGYRLTGFHVGFGDNNTIKNSVAVGVQGNVDSSGFTWPESGSGSVWNFNQDNISHNNKVDGIFTWQNNNDAHHVRDFAVYHNGEYGIDHGAYVNAYEYSGGYVYGNKKGGIKLPAVAGLNREINQPLRFENIIIDGANISQHAVFFSEHALATSRPTSFKNVAMRNIVEQLVFVRELNRGGIFKNQEDIADRIVFEDPDYDGTNVFGYLQPRVHPDSYLKIFTNGNLVEEIGPGESTTTRTVRGNVPLLDVTIVAPPVETDTSTDDNGSGDGGGNANSAAADLNSDGVVNIFDLSILLNDWSSANPRSDINGDGTVNIFDLSLLLGAWSS